MNDDTSIPAPQSWSAEDANLLVLDVVSRGRDQPGRDEISITQGIL